jgi:hypothetical protein
VPVRSGPCKCDADVSDDELAKVDHIDHEQQVTRPGTEATPPLDPQDVGLGVSAGQPSPGGGADCPSTCRLSDRVHAVWFPSGPQRGAGGQVIGCMPYQAKPSKAVADLASHIPWFRRVPTSVNLIGVEFRCQLVPAFPDACPAWEAPRDSRL